MNTVNTLYPKNNYLKGSTILLVTVLYLDTLILIYS